MMFLDCGSQPHAHSFLMTMSILSYTVHSTRTIFLLDNYKYVMLVNVFPVGGQCIVCVVVSK